MLKSAGVDALLEKTGAADSKSAGRLASRLRQESRAHMFDRFRLALLRWISLACRRLAACSGSVLHRPENCRVDASSALAPARLLAWSKQLAADYGFSGLVLAGILPTPTPVAVVSARSRLQRRWHENSRMEVELEMVIRIVILINSSNV